MAVTQVGPVETMITIDGATPPVGTVRIADYTGKTENGRLDGDKSRSRPRSSPARSPSKAPSAATR